jgi:hypothetical protein
MSVIAAGGLIAAVFVVLFWLRFMRRDAKNIAGEARAALS